MLSWTNSLSVGNEYFDNKHKEVFAKINELFVAMREGEGKASVLRVLDTLEPYLEQYFQEEEKLQLEKKYPEYKYNIHHTRHEEFKAELKRIRLSFETTGVSAIFVISTEQRIISWWKHHIDYMDKELSQFIEAHKN
jgi:hemerythrin